MVMRRRRGEAADDDDECDDDEGPHGHNHAQQMGQQSEAPEVCFTCELVKTCSLVVTVIIELTELRQRKHLSFTYFEQQNLV